jgi:wyosine [tRNA(Phe)-imidazoG37] synthetase (radical SAM superfamily)
LESNQNYEKTTPEKVTELLKQEKPNMIKTTEWDYVSAVRWDNKPSQEKEKKDGCKRNSQKVFRRKRL